MRPSRDGLPGNPSLRDLIPKDLDFYAYDGGLVIVAADAQRYRIRTPESAAETLSAHRSIQHLVQGHRQDGTR